ncbi:MAG: multidrug transporter [Methylophaga sp.]|nr:MAG: multidrug transporter [Methylophaga sp.]
MKPATSSLSTLLYTLAALIALTPLAVDAYLPAMPVMATYFSTSIHNIELSLSLFLAGFSLGQLVGGPFSDHFGRRHTIFSGLLIFAIGTIGIIFSASIADLLSFRGLQAFGGGIAIVNCSAIIRDISSGKDSARNLSHMALMMMMAPLFAPIIGVLLLQINGWHSIFVFLLVYAVLIAFFIYRNVPETRQIHQDRPNVLRRYLSVLIHRHALGYLFALSCASGGMFAFITSSPSVYMGYFEVSETFYPLLFGANIISMVIMNRLNVHLLPYFEPSTLLSLGQLIQLSSGLILLGHISLSNTPSLPVVTGLIMLFIGSQSFIVANATSSAIEFFPNNSGTATALLGASAFATGAVTGSLVSLLGDGTPLPMAMVMAGCAILGLVLRVLFHGRKIR